MFRLAAFSAVIWAGHVVPTSLYPVHKQSCDSGLQIRGYLASLKVRERMLVGFPSGLSHMGVVAMRLAFG